MAKISELKFDDKNFNNEVWREVVGFNSYEVSNYGRIRNSITRRILKTSLNTYGYQHFSVRVGENIKRKYLTVHRVVAEAFIPNLNNYPQVNHKNGVKTDNRIENLEWCSVSENRKHAHRVGLWKSKREVPVLCVETGKTFRSMQEASRECGFFEGSISQSVRKGHSCYGYHFVRLEKETIWRQ